MTAPGPSHLEFSLAKTAVVHDGALRQVRRRPCVPRAGRRPILAFRPPGPRPQSRRAPQRLDAVAAFPRTPPRGQGQRPRPQRSMPSPRSGDLLRRRHAPADCAAVRAFWRSELGRNGWEPVCDAIPLEYGQSRSAIPEPAPPGTTPLLFRAGIPGSDPSSWTIWASSRCGGVAQLCLHRAPSCAGPKTGTVVCRAKCPNRCKPTSRLPNSKAA